MDSEVINGFALAATTAGVIHHVKNAKVAVFAGGMDLSKTEGKGTVNITTAEQLEKYSLGEETEMENFIRGIAESGANVVVSGQSLSDITLHFVEKYKV
jgi:T-complex protein 1 subunit theta